MPATPSLHRSPSTCLLVAGITALVTSLASFAADDTDLPFTIQRAAGAIHLDGSLADPGWQGALHIGRWYEARPGDNVQPRVKNSAYVTYDEQFLYVGFDFEDPDPRKIRAPLGDRDDVPPYSDCVGVVIIPGAEEKTGQEFVVNPRGIQWDGLISDVTGEDATPDFFWESAARISEGGWTAEMRIPFSTLRYKGSDPSGWRILMYRNHPREYRYEYYTSTVPRDRNCLLCNARPLTGLSGLPTGGHWVVAPFVSATQIWEPEAGLGTSLVGTEETAEGGMDAKWMPNPDTVLDATINPDFSQIESDVAQITANERFALYWPEKRPFFMEGADLFKTPIQAVYTRSFTSPRWGARATGGWKDTRYTLLVGRDTGGGEVILPGPYGSGFATQNFESWVAIARVRHDIGRSFASFLLTDREIEGGGYNRVLGPDFEIRPTQQDVVKGQYLLSLTENPDTPDPNDGWSGGEQPGHAGVFIWSRATGKWDHYLLYKDVSEGFRADNGYVPSAGYRARYGEVGRTFWPKGKPITRLRLFAFSEYDTDYDGEATYKQITPGLGFDARWDSFVRLEFNFDEVRNGDQALLPGETHPTVLSGGEVFHRRQIRPTMWISPGQVVPRIEFQGVFGDEVDFRNDRLGTGATVKLTAEFRPTNHLQLSAMVNRQWLDVDAENGQSGRLFTADVARLRAMYAFNEKIWLRLVAQWVETRRDPTLYTCYVDDPDVSPCVEEHTGELSGSAVFAYKVNWQTVAYLGYADNREIDQFEELVRSGRQVFFKLSYAFRG